MRYKHHVRLQIKKIIIALILILIILLFFLLGKHDAVDGVLKFMKENFVLGMIIYILYAVISEIIIPLPIVPLWPVASYLYGFWLGVFLTTVGSAIGSSITFLIARKFGREFVVKIIGKHVFREVEHLTDIDNPKKFILVRILGINYFDTISYVVGLSNIPFKTYFIVTNIIAGIWTLLLFAIIGSAGGLNNIRTFLSLMTGYAILILIGTLFWEIYHKNHVKKTKFTKNKK